MTTPTEFVLWLNGAAGVMGEAPTPEQWEAIKEKMNESLGFLAAKKLLERAEDQIVRDREIEAKRKEEAQMAKLKSEMAQKMAEEAMRQQQQRADRGAMKIYPDGMLDATKRPMLIGGGQNLLRESMGLYDPALAPKAVLGALRADACVSEKSDDMGGAVAMALNYAKEAK